MAAIVISEDVATGTVETGTVTSEDAMQAGTGEVVGETPLEMPFAEGKTETGGVSSAAETGREAWEEGANRRLEAWEGTTETDLGEERVDPLLVEVVIGGVPDHLLEEAEAQGPGVETGGKIAVVVLLPEDARPMRRTARIRDPAEGADALVLPAQAVPAAVEAAAVAAAAAAANPVAAAAQAAIRTKS